MKTKDTIERHVEQSVKHYVTKAFKILFYIILGLVVAFLVGYVVMHLWNWLMPYLFGVPEVSYWQAVGVLVLSKIIFGFGGGDGPSKGRKGKKGACSKRCGSLKKDFSEWEHYDEFWKEEGEKAYKDYLNKNQQPPG